MAESPPELDAHLISYGPNENSARIFIDAEELALWLSLVVDWVPREDKRIVGVIRDTMMSVVAEGGRAHWVYD